MADEKGKKSYYSKRPLWQWILLYVVIGAVVYGAIYYVWAMKSGGYNSDKNSDTKTNQSPYRY